MTIATDTPLVLDRYRLLTQAVALHFAERPTLRSVVMVLSEQTQPILSMLSLQSQAQLAEPEIFTHKERVEVLRDIHERYARAYDALAILHLEVGDQFNLIDYNHLVEMVQGFSITCEQQLAEELRPENEWLPVQAGPSQTAQQTSKIIRTRKHGMLIGAARSAHGTQMVDVGRRQCPDGGALQV